MNRTFATYSFGCRVNEAERQALERKLIEAGFSLSPKSQAIHIINTCAVTAKAEREARQLIYKLRRESPEAKIVVTGCAATYWRKNQLYRDLPVDLIVDNINKEYLSRILSSRVTLRSPVLKRNQGILRLRNSSLRMTKSRRALIKIQDGCQRFCSYCIVPYLRGQPRSEKIKNLVSRIKNIVNVGNRHACSLQEIILTAINTEAFGNDTGEHFVDLLKTIINNTTVPRVSCGSINPWSIDDNFLHFYHDYLPKKRLVNFFHIPIQSGSNKILALMKRGYTTEEMMEKLNKLQRINPFALIATDVIVGFLDESENDFQETYEFLENSPISKFHIFRFSKRANTAGFYMANKLKEPSDNIKSKRAKLLGQLNKRKYEQFLAKLVNYNSIALFINKQERDYQEALLDNQVPAWIKTDKNLNGEIKNVKITKFKNGKLIGTII